MEQKEKKNQEENSPQSTEDEILMTRLDNVQDDERSVHEANLLGSGGDAEPTKSSEAPNLKGNERIRLSGAARKRYKYLLKQGLIPEETRHKAVEPMKKEPTPVKGLNVMIRLHTFAFIWGQRRINRLCPQIKATIVKRLLNPVSVERPRVSEWAFCLKNTSGGK